MTLPQFPYRSLGFDRGHHLGVVEHAGLLIEDSQAALMRQQVRKPSGRDRKRRPDFTHRGDRPKSPALQCTNKVAAAGTLVAEYTGTKVWLVHGRTRSRSHQPWPSEISSAPSHQILTEAPSSPRSRKFRSKTSKTLPNTEGLAAMQGCGGCRSDAQPRTALEDHCPLRFIRL